MACCRSLGQDGQWTLKYSVTHTFDEKDVKAHLPGRGDKVHVGGAAVCIFTGRGMLITIRPVRVAILNL